MRYQRIALILIILFAVAVNAATNIVPALHPTQRQTKTMHSGMLFCRGGAKRCLEEVKIAPQCNLLCASKIAVRHGVMSSGHSTISLPCPALNPYEQRVHTMNEVTVLL
jgi:hypothetical protein